MSNASNMLVVSRGDALCSTGVPSGLSATAASYCAECICIMLENGKWDCILARPFLPKPTLQDSNGCLEARASLVPPAVVSGGTKQATEFKPVGSAEGPPHPADSQKTEFRGKIYNNYRYFDGGRTRARTLDPLIKRNRVMRGGMEARRALADVTAQRGEVDRDREVRS